jgi:hypothetical protein
VKCLRQAANLRQHLLRDLGNFAQVGSERRSFRNVFAGALQHRAHRGQHLPEFVVQLSRDVPQRRFARRDEFLRELVPLVR